MDTQDKPHDWCRVRPYHELRERIERLEAISKALEDCLVQSIATVGNVVTALERLDERINLLAREQR